MGKRISTIEELIASFACVRQGRVPTRDDQPTQLVYCRRCRNAVSVLNENPCPEAPVATPEAQSGNS